jgi:hypothetical protein
VTPALIAAFIASLVGQLRAAEAGSPNWAVLVTLAVAVVTALGAIGVALIGLIGTWAGRRAANVTADAANRDAFTRADDAAEQRWARYTDGMYKGQAQVWDRLSTVEKRMDELEIRNESLEIRATKAEQLVSLAVVYLHRLIGWINDNLPGGNYPAPPPELNLNL